MTDTTTETTPTTDLVDTYIAMWNEQDPAARSNLIEAAWTADASYRDPLLAGTVTVAGIDVAELTDDGKFRRITGFFGDPAPV